MSTASRGLNGSLQADIGLTPNYVVIRCVSPPHWSAVHATPVKVHRACRLVAWSRMSLGGNGAVCRRAAHSLSKTLRKARGHERTLHPQPC
eukprot:6473876-Amphidinium_carterae.1